MKISVKSVEQFVEKTTVDKKEALQKLRACVLDNLPAGFEEVMSYGMIGYVVPKHIYPDGYHCDPKLPLPFINIGVQKNFIGLYHMGIYANNELLKWFQQEYAERSKYKLDMGKSCIRFKRMDDIPYELVAELVQKISVNDWIESYEKAIKP